MVKIAHESPIASFDTIQQYTDYDYALVHLFVENEEYLAKFEEAKLKEMLKEAKTLADSSLAISLKYGLKTEQGDNLLRLSTIFQSSA